MGTLKEDIQKSLEKYSWVISHAINQYGKSFKHQKFNHSRDNRLIQLAQMGTMFCKSITPKQTGNLRRSITYSITKGGTQAKIYIKPSGREYARFVEYGTGIRGKGSPHFKPPVSWRYNLHKELYGKDWVGFVGREFMFQTYLYLFAAIRQRKTSMWWYEIRFTTFRNAPAIIINSHSKGGI